MFNCHGCQKPSKPHESMTRVPVKTRAASYPFRKDANSRKVGGQIEKKPDKGGQGTETVKEVKLCPRCAKQFEEKAAS